MANWRNSMQRTYEFYSVDPNSWKDVDKLEYITDCSINWDLDAETLGSATFDSTEVMTEGYVRVYMVINQNGVQERQPLGTFLVQTPGDSFNGLYHSYSMDAYTPLIELKDTSPPFGYTVLKNENIMDMVVALCKEHLRAPVVFSSFVDKKIDDDFVAETSDTWLSFISDLMANADYHFDIDEMGQVLFAPDQETASLQPVEIYEDDDISILYPEMKVERDLYEVPNVVEVLYSNDSESYFSKVVNDDINSPISTVNRGREVLSRDTSPSLSGTVNQDRLDEYAEKLLKEKSTLEYTISYKHGFTPIRIGSCIRINYSRAGMTNLKCKIMTQSFKCDTECAVTETATYTNKLWG